MTPATMRVARLHGVGDLRVETVPVPQPSSGELLVRVEACGVCPTDVRKFVLGLHADEYPLNPGHEWVGRVEAVGAGVEGWAPGERLYGDTYAGYGEYALLRARAQGWSAGAVRVTTTCPSTARCSSSRWPTACTRCSTRAAWGRRTACW